MEWVAMIATLILAFYSNWALYESRKELDKAIKMHLRIKNMLEKEMQEKHHG